MKKNQIIEFILIIAIISLFICIIAITLSSLNIFEYGIPDSSFKIPVYSLIGVTTIFIVNYIIKIYKEKNKNTKIIWSVIPILVILFTCVFPNGMIASSNIIFNIIGVTLGILMIFLYNVLFYYYYGNNNTCYISLVLYNITVIVSSILGLEVNYINNYYLVYLLIFIEIGYVELFIRNII